MSRLRHRSLKVSDLSRPAVLFLVPIGISLVAWLVLADLVPALAFDKRTPLSGASVAVVVVWLVWMLALIVIGQHLGSRRLPEFDLEDWAERTAELEVRLMVLALLGAAIFAVIVFQGVDVLESLGQQTSNDLDKAVPDAAGLQTLRYVVAPAAGLSFARAIILRRWTIVATLNVVALLLVALVSARILIVLAVAIGIFVASNAKPAMRVTVRMILFILLALFVVNIPFNYFRNANYYEERGVSNPIMMSGSQITSYLTAPPQAWIHVANRVTGGPDQIDVAPSIDGLRALFVPSFFRPEARDGKVGFPTDFYGPGLDLDQAQTTNSMFADLSAEHSVGVAFLAGVAALLAAYLVERSRSSCRLGVQLAGGVILYGFVEAWRIYFWSLGLPVFCCAVCLLVGWRSKLTASGSVGSDSVPSVRAQQVPAS